MRRGKRLDERAKTLAAQHLQKLADEASPEAAESFTTDYATLLPRFVERIVSTVGVRDNDLVLDASLGLKTKSWLVGALRMNQLCSELELALALADWAAATAVARGDGTPPSAAPGSPRGRPTPRAPHPPTDDTPRRPGVLISCTSAQVAGNSRRRAHCSGGSSAYLRARGPQLDFTVVRCTPESPKVIADPILS